MKNLKTILCMYLIEKYSMRKIAARTGIPYSTIYDNITLANAKGLGWQQVKTMSEEALENLLSSDKQRPLPNFAYLEKELKRAGVTLQLLWHEYKQAHPEGYQYSRFCEMYEIWCKKNDVYTPMPHKAGEELFVDYSGDKMSFVCPFTNIPQEAEIFVSGRMSCEQAFAKIGRCESFV